MIYGLLVESQEHRPNDEGQGACPTAPVLKKVLCSYKCARVWALGLGNSRLTRFNVEANTTKL
jgi:hypothetical protein